MGRVDQQRRSTGLVAAVASSAILAMTIIVYGLPGPAAGTTGRTTVAATSISPVVAASFPLGITGLATNPDGSRTLWVLNSQPASVTVNDTDIFAIVDVVFRGAPGYKLKIRSGSNCNLTSSQGGSRLECLPNIGANQLIPLVTFTSNRPYPTNSPQTVELNSSSEVTVASNFALPRSGRSAAAIRAYLGKRFEVQGVRSTVVDVQAAKPTEFAYTLSRTSVPLGWVTFVVTNRGRLTHSFQVCPTSGEAGRGKLINNCLQTSGANALSDGESYAPEVDDTLPLTSGNTGFFTMRFTAKGKYEYLSDVSGQPVKGAKGQLTVD